MIKTTFQKFAEHVTETDKRIIFWGAGAIGKVLMPYICHRYGLDAKVLGYIDNNPVKQGQEIELASRKTRVCSCDLLKGLNPDRYILMISNGDFYPVLEQLEAMPGMRDTMVCIAPMIQLQEERESQEDGIRRDSADPLIPRVIHYCWFSERPLPVGLQRCVDSWREKCPDYEIICWNEKNYDYMRHPYTRQAYEAGKWGFIPDLARLEILYEQGGFYLDTDVELLKSLDSLRYQEGFCGREDWGHVNFGGGSGCVRHSGIVGALLDFRRDVPFLLADGHYNLEASGYFETKPLVDRGLSVINQTEAIDGFNVYASEFFSPYNYISGKESITDQTVSIHYFSGSWLGEAGSRYRRQTREKFQTISAQLSPFEAWED